MCATFYAMLYRKSVLAALLAFIFLSFFGTLGVSAWTFPQNYDWRYRVISNLLSPRDNPCHYWLPACGIAFTAVFMLPFAGYLRRNLEIASPRAARVTGEAFAAGVIALLCPCFVVPQHLHDVLGIRRLHEFLARSAAGFIAIGMLTACWCAWKIRGRSLFGARLFWTWSFVTLFPLAGIFFSESLLLLTRLKPSWAMPVRSMLRHSVFWHLGFWQCAESSNRTKDHWKLNRRQNRSGFACAASPKTSRSATDRIRQPETKRTGKLTSTIRKAIATKFKGRGRRG